MRWAAVGVDALSMRVSRSRLVLRSAARFALGGLIVALAVAPATAARAQGGKPAQAAQAGCPAADTATTDIRHIQKATLCLHNRERLEDGLSKLRWNRELAGVAGKHARDMVARHYFAHGSAGGRDHMDRIAASGYNPAVGCWTAGENLFFSSGRSTPRQLLNAWMNSPAHRQIILRRGWHDFGLGVVARSPGGDANGLTVVALFGTRSKQACS
jgi:uncharacterized protein YkwD